MSADQKVAGGVLVLHGRPPRREVEKICFPEARGRSRGDRTPYHGRPPGFLKNRAWTPEGGGRPQGDRTPSHGRPPSYEKFLSCFLLSYHAFICVFTCLYTYLSTCLHVSPYVLVFFRALIAFDVAKGGEK